MPQPSPKPLPSACEPPQGAPQPALGYPGREGWRRRRWSAPKPPPRQKAPSPPRAPSATAAHAP
eukprot:682115-Pyramimonas_sp.AAC.1